MAGLIGKGFHMSEDAGNNMSREERLAAKLRENLRRRKAQSRAIGHNGTESRPAGVPNGGEAG